MSNRYEPQKPLTENTLVLLENSITRAVVINDTLQYIRLVNHYVDFLYQLSDLRKSEKYQKIEKLRVHVDDIPPGDTEMDTTRNKREYALNKAKTIYKLIQELKEPTGLSIEQGKRHKLRYDKVAWIELAVLDERIRELNRQNDSGETPKEPK